MTTAGKRQAPRKKAPLTPEQLAAAEKAAQIAAEEKEAKRQRVAAEKAEVKRKVAAEKEAKKQQLAATKNADKQRVAAEKAAAKQAAAAEQAAKKQQAAAEKEQQRIAVEKRLANLPKIVLDRILSHAKPDAGPYPVSLADLTTACRVSGTELVRVLKSLEASKTIVKCKAAAPGRANDAGFVLAADVRSASAPLIKEAFSHLRTVALKPTTKSTTRSTSADTAFKSGDLAAAIFTDKEWKPAFSAAIEQAADQDRLPDEIAWVKIKGIRYFFQRDGLTPARHTRLASPPPLRSNLPNVDGSRELSPVGRQQSLTHFAAAFDAAYDRARQAAPKYSQLSLRGLREALPQFSRAEFDANLGELRSAGKYTLESNEGATGGLTQADRDAGIVEGGSTLIYVARK